MLNDTIVALATPPGMGGIAVLRLSGPRAWEIAEIISTPPYPPAKAGGKGEFPPTSVGGQKGGALSSESPPVHGGTKGGPRENNLANTARFAKIYTPTADVPPLAPPQAGRKGGFPPTSVGGQKGGSLASESPPTSWGDKRGEIEGTKGGVGESQKELIDEVVLTFFKAPRSYTGEDVVEISCHGGRYAATQILELVLEHGARHARPGEFTERAFLNGKMDLAQAEAVASLIHARTREAGRAAARQLAGGLSEKVRAMRSQLLDLLALVELELDFSEEDVAFQTRAARLSMLDHVLKETEALAATFQRGRLVREGLRVALVGAPNAGKSTLLNTMAGEDRAIVSPEPGTTRDVVEAHIEVEGIELILQDTAGLREAFGIIESEGIARARRAIERADVVLLIVDASDPRWPEEDIFALLKEKCVIQVWNKIDLRSTLPPFTGGRNKFPPTSVGGQKGGSLSFTSWGDVRGETERTKGGWPSADVSALTGEGVDVLLCQIKTLMIGEDVPSREIVVAEARHHECLTRAVAGLDRARAQLSAPTLLAADLRDAVNALGEITGETIGEDILDRIFSKFCIGK